MAIARRHLTLEEFLKQPERKPALEYLDGRVTQKVAPNVWHSMLQLWLGTWFNQYCVPRRLAMAFTELRTTFTGSSPVPDVSVVRWDRLPRDESGLPLQDFYQSPDIAIEIISPGQRLQQLRERCQWYTDHGVPLSLLIDPRRKTVLAFSPDADERLLRGGDVLDLGAVIPGLQLAVVDLFDALRFD